jgi:hypothetical protein
LGKPGDSNAARRNVIWCEQEPKSRRAPCLLLAQSGHHDRTDRRPLFGVKQHKGAILVQDSTTISVRYENAHPEFFVRDVAGMLMGATSLGVGV